MDRVLVFGVGIILPEGDHFFSWQFNLMFPSAIFMGGWGNASLYVNKKEFGLFPGH